MKRGHTGPGGRGLGSLAQAWLCNQLIMWFPSGPFPHQALFQLSDLLPAQHSKVSRLGPLSSDKSLFGQTLVRFFWTPLSTRSWLFGFHVHPILVRILLSQFSQHLSSSLPTQPFLKPVCPFHLRWAGTGDLGPFAAVPAPGQTFLQATKHKEM